MDEESRHQRNRERLVECFPVFAVRVRAVIDAMERQGFRPRIQDAHRTDVDQLAAFRNGTSRVRFGFHNITSGQGKPEALAVDLLDDNHPLNPTREYIIRLAASAQAEGLQTGILFGLPAALRRGAERAISELDFRASVKIGFDPTHVEVAGISIEEAREGKRPS